jgi:hypothetical protein
MTTAQEISEMTIDEFAAFRRSLPWTKYAAARERYIEYGRDEDFQDMLRWVE